MIMCLVIWALKRFTYQNLAIILFCVDGYESTKGCAFKDDDNTMTKTMNTKITFEEWYEYLNGDCKVQDGVSYCICDDQDFCNMAPYLSIFSGIIIFSVTLTMII